MNSAEQQEPCVSSASWVRGNPLFVSCATFGDDVLGYFYATFLGSDQTLHSDYSGYGSAVDAL